MSNPDDFINPETGTRGLKAIMEEAIADSLWETRPVEDEPEIILDQWQIFEIDGNRYFMGYNHAWREGRVSSRVVTFDEEEKKGITRSGRVYQLVGESGFNGDANYVLGAWLRRNAWTRDDVEYIKI